MESVIGKTWFHAPHVDEEYGDSSLCSNGIYAEIAPGFELQIATVVSDCISDHEKVARLIAAAPELLEALVSLFDADMETCMLMDGKEDQLLAISKARLAIAKALGE